MAAGLRCRSRDGLGVAHLRMSTAWIPPDATNAVVRALADTVAGRLTAVAGWVGATMCSTSPPLASNAQFASGLAGSTALSLPLSPLSFSPVVSHPLSSCVSSLCSLSALLALYRRPEIESLSPTALLFRSTSSVTFSRFVSPASDCAKAALSIIRAVLLPYPRTA